MPPGWFYPFIAIFVVIMAVAMVVQLAMLAGLYFGFRKLRADIDALLSSQVHPLLNTVRTVSEDVRRQVEKLGVTLEELQQTARAEVARVDGLITEAADRARLQVIRVDELVSDTLGRVEETVDYVQRGVIRPVKEIQALVHGLRSMIDQLIGGRRRAPERATQDEELFI